MQPVEKPWSVLASRPALSAYGVLALALALELVPGAQRLRVLSRPPEPDSSVARSALPEATATRVGEAELKTESEGSAALAPLALAPAAQQAARAEPEPKVPIVDASGKALHKFYRALQRTQSKQTNATTRIAHFGDSIVASDYVSGTLRRRFQEAFGDAGHGFSLIANAWPAYFHSDVERYATAGWKVSRVVGPLAEDGLYGLGCVSFKAEKNALARFGTTSKGDFGRAVSRFEIFYLEEPSGGAFQISVDGQVREVVDTHGPSKASRTRVIQVPDGPHELEILTKQGTSRLFGVVMERDAAGVVLDAIGIQGARIRFLDKQEDAHYAEQLKLRNFDLLVYEFGANESADGFLYPMPEYHDTMKQVIAQGQAALPESSCLVIGAMDRAVQKGDELIGIRVLPFLIEEQRKVAAELGCGFFDTYTAMGGRGSMAKWVKRGLGQADLTHPTAVGSDVIGTWIYRALWRGYQDFLSTQKPSAPSSSADSRSPSSR
ncbi:MAG TPA: hypothetical protein VFQ61_08200 [Polyangiaceae bacterium]|nr:hypothetical protein [Polyangiaceae bacterium]